MRGCIGPAPQPLFTLSTGEHIYECPGKLVPNSVKNFLKVLNFCEKFQSFPVAGTVLDQTYSFLQAVEIVEKVRSEKEDSERENKE